MKFSAIAAALALAGMASMQANAATTSDDVSVNGSGDVVFQAVDFHDGDFFETLDWDLSDALDDLTALSLASGTVASFTLSDAGLNSFLAGLGDNIATMRWRVVGVSRKANTATTGDFGAVTTATNAGFDFPNSLAGLGNGMTVIDTMINAMGNAPVNLDNDSAVASSGGSAGWLALPETHLGAENAVTGLGSADFYFVHRFGTAEQSIQELALGTIKLAWDGSSALLCFNTASCGVSAVPVPAAVWLLGTAVIGLAGATRRKPA